MKEVYMESQNLDKLEEKITKMLTLMRRLKEENHNLQKRNQELQTLVHEKENAIQALRTQSDDYSSMKNEVDSCHEKQTRIRTKVEGLLQKLQEFEDIE
jgi:hypothetical protein